MDLFRQTVDLLNYYIWSYGIPVGDESIPLVVIALLGAGFFLTLRLGFIQLRKLGHGFAVTSGKYDDPDEPGDVSHFQALTTALSATVGIGNIAGVAIAIHYGGPGAVFWMWMTALLGMAVKYAEVTLAQHYRHLEKPDLDARKWEGSVSGGPMYYIERGLGPRWKPMAVFFAVMLGLTAFLTGNGVQANTVADTMRAAFGIEPWITGLVTTSIVAMVILGGITRIGRVTAILAPAMAAIYVTGALFIILRNLGGVVPSLALIVREAFNPTAGVAGTGVGAILVTMMWGVKRGLFSNEAGQGSAPIAHAAAKTDEPVSEGVVALLEPFIDTIVICTMTGLVIILTGVWNEKLPTEITLAGGGHVSYLAEDGTGRIGAASAPAEIMITDGYPADTGTGAARLAWHDVAIERFFTDAGQTIPFSGTIRMAERSAVTTEGVVLTSLFGDAVESAAPLTMLGFQRGLPGEWGRYIVLLSVFLFAVSTAISWSYYGDRCAFYIFGPKAVLPYKAVYVAMHFVGAVLPLASAWALGDVFLGIVILPNLIALVLLSPVVARLTRSYFERKPWIENAEARRRALEAKRMQKA